MRRVPELDALRGVAAVMILCLHLGLSTYPVLGSAVDLFFVLSGYLITRIILDHATGPGFLAPFYVRRCLRIWPIYYAALLTLVAMHRWLPYPQRIDGIWNYLTYTQFVQHYWFSRPPWFSVYFAHTWTLAAEEQFYVLWPLAAAFGGRRALRTAIPLLIATAFLARLWLWPMLLATNCDGFALGGLLAYWLGSPGLEGGRRGWAVTATLAGLAAATLSYPWWRGPIEAALSAHWPGVGGRIAVSINATRLFGLYFAVVGLVVVFAGRPWLAPLRDRRLCYLGTISYGLYLYHVPLYAMISPSHFDASCRDSMALDALKLAATFALAACSWEFFEKPLLRRKERWPYPPPGETGAAAVTRRPHLFSRERRAASSADRRSG